MEAMAFDLSKVYQVHWHQAPLLLGGSSGWAAEWLLLKPGLRLVMGFLKHYPVKNVQSPSAEGFTISIYR